MERMSHSRFLFTTADGEAMEFCVRSREETDRLAALIEHGGGLVTKTCGPNVIRLINLDCKALNVRDEEKVLYVQYILDCVEQNKLLDMISYSLKIESKSISDISTEGDSDSSPNIETVDSIDFDISQANVNHRDVARDNVSRAKVNKHDTAQANVTEHKILQCNIKKRATVKNRRIIDYILEHADSLRGMYQFDFYEELLEKEVMAGTKATFCYHMRRISDDVKLYKLTIKEEKLVLDVLSKMRKDKIKFKQEEDMKMIEYVIKNNLYARVREKILYKEMADKKLLQRDVTSMYKQFTEVILSNLKKYDLSAHCMRLLSGENSNLDVQKGISSKIERRRSDDKSESGESSSSDFSESRPGSTKKQKCVKSNDSNETSMQIAEKRKYSDEGINNDISDASSDDFSYTPKVKKVRRVSPREEQLDSSRANRRSCSAHSKDRDTVLSTDKTKSPKPNCETVLSRSMHDVSDNGSNAVDDIANEVAAERINCSNEISEYLTKESSQNEVAVHNEPKPETKDDKGKDKASPKVKKKIQQTLKFFDTEKYKLSLTDTLDDLITEDKELADPECDVNSSAAGEISTIKKFLTAQLTSSSDCLKIEDDTIPVVDGQKEQFSLPSPQPDNCKNALQDNKVPPLLNEIRSQNDISSQEVANAQALNHVVTEGCNEKKNGGENEDNLLDLFIDQVDESSQEYVSPTVELFGTETLSLNLNDEVAENHPMIPEGSSSAKQNHFTKCLSILKNIEAEVVDMTQSRIKNNLQDNINKLYFKFYQQRFKESIGSIMEKEKLSATDKAILLKCVAYTNSTKTVNDFRS